MKAKTLLLSSIAAIGLPALAMLMPRTTADGGAMWKEQLSLRSDATQPLKAKTVIAKAPKSNANVLEGRTLYGNLISHVDFNNYSSTEIPMGIYKFEVNGSELVDTPLLTNFAYDLYSGTYARTGFYGARVASVFGYINAIAYYDFDVENYVERECNMVEANGSYGLIPSVMCYDPLDDTIYAIQYNDDLSGAYWSTFNRESLELEIKASWKSKFQIYAMAACPDGYIYGINADGDLYRINKGTGIASYVGTTGVNVLGYNQSAIYDGLTGGLIWAAITDQGAALYLVDINTGEASLVQSLPNGEEIVGLYTLDNGALANAPGAVSDLRVEYAQPGSTQASLSFTVPSTTYQGSGLNGNVETTVLVDGEAMYESSCAPGQNLSLNLDLSNDNHYYCVVNHNEDGYSPYAYLYEYAGWDTPLPVENVTFEIEDGTSKLNWTAPQSGVNGGYIDSDALCYEIIRMPGEKVVASGIKETTYSEVLPTEMRAYSYKIIAYNGNEKKSEAVETQSILYGNAFPTPYSQTFDTTSSTELFDILNLDGGDTWTLSGWNPEIDINTTYGASEPSNDWLITPPILLEAGKLYQFNANLRTYAAPYVETLELAYATNYDSATAEGFETFATWQDFLLTDFTDKDEYFSVPADGKYYIGLHYTSDPSIGSMIRLASLGVNEVGHIEAPEAVTELVITADENNALAATLSFVTPTTNLKGESISAISDVKIYRDGELIGQLGALTAGTQTSYVDENVPTVGMHTYRVVPVNENGDGKGSESTLFIGAYSAPYSADLSDTETLKLWSMNYTGIPDSDIGNISFGASWLGGLGMSYFSMVGPVEMMAYSPGILFEDETVYNLNFNFYNGNYQDSDSYEYWIGLSDGTIEGFEKKEKLPVATNYTFEPQECEIVVSEGGKKHLSWYVYSNQDYHYIDISIDKVELTKATSAKAPYTISDFKAVPDATGLNKANITFAAPDKDYVGRDLTSLSSVNIYRGSSAIPVKVFENPTPGATLNWLDEEALSGENTYTVVGINEYGHGKAFVATVYVGYDVPMPVSDFTIAPTSDNQKPQLSWTAPTTGVNGGIIDFDNLEYAIVKIDPTVTDDSEAIKILEVTSGTSYTVNREATEYQAVEYYGVLSMTNQGMGGLAYAYTILGKPYEVPFKESFPQGELETSPWLVIESDDYASASPVAGEGMTSYSVEPQDGDNGAFYFYNGSYYESFGGVTMASPKITLGNQNAILKIWIYNTEASVYSQVPQVIVQATTDEVNIDTLATITVSNGQVTGWQEYEVDLSAYKDAPSLCLLLTGKTSGYNDILYIDNITIETSTGITSLLGAAGLSIKGLNGGVMINGANSEQVRIYDASGRLVDSFVPTNNEVRPLSSGIYLITVNGTTQKIIVR